MPTKNRIKEYAPEAYYHVYNRGVNKRTVFLDNKDYTVFLSLFKRYLSDEQSDQYNRSYEDLSSEVKLLAYCLMPSHFHLLVYQDKASGMTNLLQRVLTSYSIYFNKMAIGSLITGARQREIFKATDLYIQVLEYYANIPEYVRDDESPISESEVQTIIAEATKLFNTFQSHYYA